MASAVGVGLQEPVGAQSVTVSAWLADGDPASGDLVDSHLSDSGEFTDSDAEVDLSASALDDHSHPGMDRTIENFEEAVSGAAVHRQVAKLGAVIPRKGSTARGAS